MPRAHVPRRWWAGLAALPLLVPVGSPSPPTTDAERFRVRNDIAFAATDGFQVTLDAYIPNDAGRHPGVVLVHGGSWTGGDKTDLAAVGASLAQLGWVALSVNYRLGVEQIDQQAQDVVATVQWARDHAGELRLDPRKIALVGASAGGHLAALAATRGAPVIAVVTWSGVFDLAALAPRSGSQAPGCNAACQSTFGAGVLAGVLGCSYDQCPTRYEDASPVTQAENADAPMLLTNSVDDAVPADQARAMARALRATGVVADTVVVAGAAHGYELAPEVWDATIGFLGEQASPETEDAGSSRTTRLLVLFVAGGAVVVALIVWRTARGRRASRRRLV